MSLDLVSEYESAYDFSMFGDYGMGMGAMPGGMMGGMGGGMGGMGYGMGGMGGY